GRAPRVAAGGGGGAAARAGWGPGGGHGAAGGGGRASPPASSILRDLGVTVSRGWEPRRLDGVDLVVCGNAVTRDNPEARAARERGLRTVSFPQALEELFLGGRRPPAVPGARRETAHAARVARGGERGWVIGGASHDLPLSARVGGSPWFVVEGDEYDSAYFDKEAKFLHYHPAMLLLTAVEFDHADIYRDIDAVKGAFRKLLALLRPGAPLVACGDFPHVLDVVSSSGADLQ